MYHLSEYLITASIFQQSPEEIRIWNLPIKSSEEDREIA